MAPVSEAPDQLFYARVDQRLVRLGERRDTELVSEPVPLTMAPNVPMAEVLCGKLKEAGIPSYYKDAGIFGLRLGGSGVNPTLPVEIFVNPHDLERAQHLLGQV